MSRLKIQGTIYPEEAQATLRREVEPKIIGLLKKFKDGHEPYSEHVEDFIDVIEEESLCMLSDPDDANMIGEQVFQDITRDLALEFR